ncbi:hypothetical protein HDU98_003710 [Podochytrium sp. JEL0797]|nr:hypothetical protein HDU98_003710 [Podochytrium sp. JEL0797]
MSKLHKAVVKQFRDRAQAGTYLATLLAQPLLPSATKRVVLAIPRGGVPVAFSIAKALDAKLDVFLAKDEKDSERRNVKYRGGKPPVDVKGKEVYLVDDGISTGTSMQSAIAFLRSQNPSKIIAVAPVGSPSSCKDLERVADEVVVPLQPESFQDGVFAWYGHFPPQPDDVSVLELLEKAKEFGKEAE